MPSSFSLLCETESYVHRICGMESCLREHVIGHPQWSHPAVEVETLRTRIQNLLSEAIFGSLYPKNKFSIGLVIASPMKDYLKETNYSEDIVMVLILDPLNIDSKQCTFVSARLPSPVMDAVFSCLYRLKWP